MSFDERVEVSGQVDVAYVIIWEFAEWIKPQLVLQSPHETFTFKFNPTMPNIVCGGCYSGQAIMWDLNEAMEAIERKKQDKKKDDGNDDEDEERPIVQHAAMSHIDTSHKRMVADMVWLPADSQVNYKGQILAEEHLDGKTYQFMTIAGDGQALIWDIRYTDIAAGKYPHIAKALKGAGTDKGKDVGKVPWLPVFRMNVKRLEGVGELSLCKLLAGFSGFEETGGGNGGSVDKRSQVLCCSEEGELVKADWRAKRGGGGGGGGVGAGAGGPGSGDKKDDDDEGNDVPEYVQWLVKDHNRPCVALEKSPFFGDIVMTVSDWNFHIWKLGGGSEKPVFTSPNASTYLTGGRWSPTRPGMLFISKEDGCVDVWDFTDSSYR